MSTLNLAPAPGIPGFEFDAGSGPDPLGGGRNKHCQWGDDLCTETPSHFVAQAVREGREPASPEYYCARHWVLTLAHLQEVELDWCSCPLPQHIAQAGAIVGPVWGN